MRRSHGLLALFLALPLLAALAEANPQGNLEALKDRARTAKPADATFANSKVVRQEVEIADQYFKDGDGDKAQAAVDEAVHYAELAGSAATRSSKHLKEAEILLREAGRRLEEIRRSLAFEDQPPLQKAEDRLEKIRSDILSQMFAPQKAPEKKP